MSGQANDIFIYKRKEYAISAIEFDSGFFSISSFGISPKMFHTACYRGYIATFTIHKKNLVLCHLYTNNGNNPEFEPPLIDSKLPRIEIRPNLIEKYKDTLRDYHYEDIKQPIDYTGSIIICDDLIMDRYRHMGYQKPASYKKVILLTFNKGAFVSAKDISALAALVREEKFDRAKEDMKKQNLVQWIDDCFNISFLVKAKELNIDEGY